MSDIPNTKASRPMALPARPTAHRITETISCHGFRFRISSDREGNRARLGTGRRYQHAAAVVEAIRVEQWHSDRVLTGAFAEDVPPLVAQRNRFEQAHDPPSAPR